MTLEKINASGKRFESSLLTGLPGLTGSLISTQETWHLWHHMPLLWSWMDHNSVDGNLNLSNKNLKHNCQNPNYIISHHKKDDCILIHDTDCT